MRKYGIIAGSKVFMYTKSINDILTDGRIEGTWTSIAEFQTDLINNRGTALQGLEKIVLIDNGLFGNSIQVTDSLIEEKMNEVIYLYQVMQHQEESSFLVVFTKNKYLESALQNFLRKDRMTDTYNLKVYYSPDGSYNLSGLKDIFEAPVQPISRNLSQGRNPEYIREQQEEQAKRLEEQKRTLKMLGALEELRRQREHIDKQISIISEQMEKQLVAAKTSDLIGDDGMEDALVAELQKEIRGDF